MAVIRTRAKKAPSVRRRFDGWMCAHPALSCVLVAAAVALALIGLFVFVTFSGSGSSADFIYNQF